MKIAIGKAMDEGVQLLIKKPLLFVPFIILAVMNFFLGKYMMNMLLQFLGPFLQGTGIPGIPGVGAQGLDDFSALEPLPETGFDTGMLPPNFQLPQEIISGMISSALAIWSQLLPIMLMGGLVTLILTLMAIKMIAQAKEGEIRMGEAFVMALRKFFLVFISSILYGLMVGVGMILLVIPGLIIAVRFYYYPYAAMVDNQGIISALSTSWNLTRGNWWRSVGLFVIFGVVGVVFMALASIFPPLSTGNLIISSIATLLVSAWSVSTLTVAYFQMKEETV